MSWLPRLLVFVPAVFLIMVVFVAPRATTARGVVEIAGRKTVKVLVWTVAMVVFMQVLQLLFFP